MGGQSASSGREVTREEERETYSSRNQETGHANDWWKVVLFFSLTRTSTEFTRINTLDDRLVVVSCRVVTSIIVTGRERTCLVITYNAHMHFPI